MDYPPPTTSSSVDDEPSETTQRSERLLVVDDDLQVDRLVVRIAQEIGFEARSVSRSGEFAAAWASFVPTVIAIDLMMPGLDGIELLRYLAKEGSEAQILVISGVDTSIIDSTSRLVNELGLNLAGVLQKPFMPCDLRDILEKIPRPSGKADESPTPARPTITKQSLIEALQSHQLYVVYQPIVSLASGRILGAEALVRWNHPSLGTLLPAQFLRQTEEAGLITPLFYEVLQQSLDVFGAGHRELADVSLSINLSPTSLIDIDLPDRIAECLDSRGFDRDRLIVEITETGAMGDPARTMDVLNRLRIKGVHLSIDDFGTGSSSLVHLYRLPFSEIKIDRAFVSDLEKREEAATITRSIVSLGLTLNLRTVAEGIEDQATYDRLLALNCERGQGFHISFPLGAESFLEVVGQDRADRSTDRVVRPHGSRRRPLSQPEPRRPARNRNPHLDG